jgi:hypothetical protein
MIPPSPFRAAPLEVKVEGAINTLVANGTKITQTLLNFHQVNKAEGN